MRVYKIPVWCPLTDCKLEIVRVNQNPTTESNASDREEGKEFGRFILSEAAGTFYNGVVEAFKEWNEEISDR